MAQPPKNKTIALSEEENAELPDWARNVKGQLDNFMSSVVDALTGRLTRTENMRVFTKTIDFTTADPVSNTWPFLLTVPFRPSRVDCGQAVAVTGTFDGDVGVTVNQWSMKDATTLSINKITGLNPSTRYQLSLFIE
jgi:hypothetical protein